MEGITTLRNRCSYLRVHPANQTTMETPDVNKPSSLGYAEPIIGKTYNDLERCSPEAWYRSKPSLGSLATKTTSQLKVLGLDGDTLGVDGGPVMRG